ncbi:Rha family transcriptional regulator [Stenotrophomonas maltophilia]|uniref:Rha family transcriptional regulator n=1 Tax=Stenotrophomonas maltophilia TaxID=40324 RepID=UPI0013DC570B|nr:Rha family transcriptional regulator [Stenotrophomonas maltophilia]
MNIDSIQDMVMLADGQPMTDSLKVAPYFGKRHGDVLRAYDRLECDSDFNQRNFASVTYLDAKGEARRVVQMTKDGFMLLVMGFTGREATKVKIAFIAAFNRMAEFIRTQASGAMERWNVAYVEYRQEREHVSNCAKDMNRWKRRKVEHQQRLQRLDPQLSLTFSSGLPL